MKKLALALALLGATSAQASIVDGDWLEKNDKLAKLDTETGIEWMSLEETAGLSISNVSDLLDSKYKGWRLPTLDEVVVFFNNVITHDTSYAGDYKIPSRFDVGNYYTSGATRVGLSFYSSSSGSWGYNDTRKALGWHLGENGELLFSGIHTESYSGGNKGYYYLANENPGNETSFNNQYGVFLISDGGYSLSSIEDPTRNANNANSPYSVSEPHLWLGFSVAFMGLMFARKKTKHMIEAIPKSP